MSATALATHLNDHLGGSVGALDLLHDLIAHPAQPDDPEFFRALRNEIAEEQDQVKALLREIGSAESSVRKAAGWLAEKVTRVKLRWDDPDRDGLRRFGLQALALGLPGKLSLSRALAAVAPAVPKLQPLDLEALPRRAEAQHAAVEARRLLLRRRQSRLPRSSPTRKTGAERLHGAPR